MDDCYHKRNHSFEELLNEKYVNGRLQLYFIPNLVLHRMLTQKDIEFDIDLTHLLSYPPILKQFAKRSKQVI